MKAANSIRRHRLIRLDDILPTLDRLMEHRADGPHVSFYVNGGRLPEDAKRARITFGNQVAAARERLRGDQEFGTDDDSVLDSCEALLEEQDFWRQRAEGLAVLANPSGTEVLRMGASLPDKWVYSSDYHLKPLLAAASQANAYWLLTLSQKRVRLFRGSELGFREVECEGLPDGYRDGMERRGFGPDSAAMMAAESRIKVDKDQLRLFFEVVQDAVLTRIGGSGLPLLVAGVGAYEPIYREVNTYRHLSDRYFEGNVDALDERELHERASDLLRRDFTQSSVRQLRRYKEASDTGEALDRLDLILAASVRGQVRSLFVPADEDLWGTFDPAEARIDRDDRCGMCNTDLYELAARQTLATGGAVYFMDAVALPRDRKVLALLRWTEETNGDGPSENRSS